VVLDPPGAAVAFVSLTQAIPPATRSASACIATLLAGAILLLLALSGRIWLAAIDIGLPAFRIAGGLLPFLLAADMLFGRSSATSAGSLPDGDITVSPWPSR
jgi:multiple antibiotic resistance protein